MTTDQRMDQRVVRVSGVPRHLFNEELIYDKLLIHFLRPSNNGGDVQSLYFPKNEEDMAILTFETEKVAERVLHKKHLLEVDGQKFPLEVMHPKVQNTEFSLPIRTILDLQHFSDPYEVEKMIKKCGLEMLPIKDLRVEIKGEFQDLKRFKNELSAKISERNTFLDGRHIARQQTVRTHQTAKGKNNPALFDSRTDQYRVETGVNYVPVAKTVNGAKPKSSQDRVYSSSSNTERHVDDVRSSHKSKATSSSKKHIDNREKAGLPTYGRSPGFDESSKANGRSPTSPTRNYSPKTTNIETSFKTTSEASAIVTNHSSPRTKSSFRAANKASPSETNHSSFRSSTSTLASDIGESSRLDQLVVDSDILEFINFFHKQLIEDILYKYSVEMNLSKQDDLSFVTLKSKFPHDSRLLQIAYIEMSEIFTNGQARLRTENIDLSEYTATSREEITNKISQYGYNHGILTMIYQNRLHLIGFSKDTFELMQQWTAIKGQFKKGYTDRSKEEVPQNVPRPPSTGRKTADVHVDGKNTSRRGCGTHSLEGSNTSGTNNGSKTRNNTFPRPKPNR
ncbi:RNA-binding protein 43 isoform 1-T2 [Discoglossus pictus]